MEVDSAGDIASAPAEARTVPHGRGWIIASVLACVAMVATVLLAHQWRDRLLAQNARIASDVRHAIADLNDAALHLALGREPGSPWQAEQGLVLLDQASRSLQRSAQSVDEAALARDVHEMAARLGSDASASAGDAARRQLRMQLALHQLSALSSRLDTAVQQRGQGIAQRTGTQFNVVAGLALLMLAAIASGLVRSERARRGAEDALSAHRADLAELVRERTAQLESALAAREKAESFAQLATDTQPTLLCYWDAGLHLRFANQAYLDWFGLRRDEVVGRHAKDIFGDALVAAHAQSLELLQRGERIELEMEVRGSRGRTGNFLSHRVPDMRDGVMAGHFYVATDVTELTNARNALASAIREREQIERFAALVADNIPGRVAYWDREMRLRYGNRQFCARSGQPLEELLGRSFDDILGRERLALIRDRVERVMGGATESFEREETDADGQTVVMQLNYLPDWHDNEVRGLVVLAMDVTAARRGEQALREINRDLEIARDRAEGAARAKSAFLANMSHEIRTPMNAVLGLTHLLLRDSNDDSQRERLLKVETAGRHLLQVINDILDLSKIEAGKLQAHVAPFSLSGLVGRCLSVIAPAAQAKGLDLQVDTDHVAQYLLGDATLLAQAVINLLGNAVKFTREGSVRLSIRVERSDGARRRLRFEVSDTGVGVAEHAQANLFHAFEQADMSTAREYGGTGLGLALTRSIAGLMGGETGMTSAVGKGSTFWFTAWVEESAVLVRDGDPAAARVPFPTESGVLRAADLALRVRSLHGGQRVLLAEDNQINQEVACELLRAAGLAVQTAADGRQAVELAVAQDFDLILMDMQMPGTDGLAATRELRALRGTGPPIIAMTANAFSEDREACLAVGMDDHVSKPVEAAVLYEALLRWLPARPRQTQAGTPPQPLDQAPSVTDIAGIDKAVALRHVGGNARLLARLLEKFAEGQGSQAEQMLGAADLADRALIRQQCHSLRGACATIGAITLADQLLALEQVLADPNAQ